MNRRLSRRRPDPRNPPPSSRSYSGVVAPSDDVEDQIKLAATLITAARDEKPAT